MYKFKYGGKKGKTINLVESPDKVVIRTKGNQDLESIKVSEESKSLIADTTEVVTFPESGVTVRKVTMSPPTTEELESTSGENLNIEAQIARRDETRAALKQEESIRFAGRVLQDADTGEVVLYTENFFVKFKDSVSESDCLQLIAKYNLDIKNKLPFATNSYFVQAREGTGLQVFEIAEKLLKEKHVEFCHPELVQERRFKAIHPLQWHLAKTTVGGKSVDAHVNIEGAWAHTRGKGVTIAVIDDGIDTDHPEFAGRVVHPFDASTGQFNAKPKEGDDNHGTPCAGMACAAGLADGASGTAPDAFLLPIRLRSGLGSMAEANAFAWAADHGADVISCSWGPTDGTWWEPDDPIHKRFTALPDSTRLALEYALTKGRKGKGCTILFAAGNGAEDVSNDGYASYPGVIAVAACNDTGKRSVYSDFGEAVWVCFPSGDFGYAPFRHPAPITTGLRTPDRIGAEGVAGDYRNNFGGTSGACPGMAGVVALMLAVNPDLTPADIKNLIRSSCIQIDRETGKYDANGHSIWYGYGRIDAGLAVENARKLKENPTGPSVEGKVRFSTAGELPLQPGGMMTGNFNPPRKVLGLNLNIKPVSSNLSIKYKTNVPGLGILENKAEGEFVGTKNGRQRIIGISLKLEGSAASKYELEYAARIQGASETITAKDGGWCGSDKKSGKTIQSVSVILKKRNA